MAKISQNMDCIAELSDVEIGRLIALIRGMQQVVILEEDLARALSRVRALVDSTTRNRLKGLLELFDPGL